jgi:hypothetical protein
MAFNQEILNAYQQYTGRAPEIDGYNYWEKKLKAGETIDWAKEFANASSDPLIKAKSDRITNDYKALYGGKAQPGKNAPTVYNPTRFDDYDNDDSIKLIERAFQKGAGRAPVQSEINRFLNGDEHGMGNFLSRYFGDYDLSDDVLGWLGSEEGAATNAAAWKKLNATPTAPTGGHGGSGGGMNAGSLLDQYLNPYRQNVLNNVIRDIGEQGEIRRNGLGAEAFQAGAYGDARHGVEGAQLTEDVMKAVSDASNSINAQGFESAMGWLDRDLNRQMQLGLANAGLDGAQADRALNGIQSSIGNAGLGMQWGDFLSGIDQSDRNWTQQSLNAQFEDFWDRQGWDREQFEGFVNFMNSLPGQTGSTTSSPNYSSWQALGSSLGGIDWSKVLGKGGNTIASVAKRMN